MKRKSLKARFWEKVDRSSADDKCWEWTASKFPTGYGHFSMNGHDTRASRTAWLLENGPIPGGLFVLHHCDNPGCVRPSHLFLGTALDNAQDSVRKGRRSGNGYKTQGELNHHSKLTASDVIEIRRSRAAGDSVQRIAARFKITHDYIYELASGKRWTHIPLAAP